MVEGEFGDRQKQVPTSGREGYVSGGQVRNEVVLGRSDGAFRRVGPVVLGRDMLAEEGGEVSRCLVIENEVGDGKRVG